MNVGIREKAERCGNETLVEEDLDRRRVDEQPNGESGLIGQGHVAPSVGHDLVHGAGPEPEGFFWLRGQGGYGTQTAPGLGEAAAALIEGEDLPAHTAKLGIGARDLSVERLR